MNDSRQVAAASEEGATFKVRSYARFVRQVGVAGIANGALSLRRILLLPVLTKQLSPDQFGIWISLVAFIELLAPIGQLRLDASLDRFLPAVEDRDELGRSVYTAISFGLLSTGLLGGGIVLAWAMPLPWDLSRVGAADLVALLVVAVLLSSLEMMGRAYFRARRLVKFHSALVVADALGFVALAALALYAGLGLKGVLGAWVVNKGALLVVEWVSISRSTGTFSFDAGLLKRFLRYGIPLLPLGLFASLMHLGDRYVIAYYHDWGLSGAYSAGYLLGNLGGLSFGPVFHILGPTIAALWERGEKRQVEEHMSFALKYCLIAAVPLVVTVAVLARPLMRLLAEEAYEVEPLVIGLIAVGVMVFMASGILQEGIRLQKKTGKITLIYGGCAGLNLALNFLVVPDWGMRGAAAATLLTHGVQIFAAHQVVRSDLLVRVEWKTLGRMLIGGGVTGYILFVSDPQAVASLIVAAILAMGGYLALMLAMGTFSKRELDFWKSLIPRMSGSKKTL